MKTVSRMVLLLLLCVSHLSATESENSACKKDKRVVGECFTIRGRLSEWNGNPTGRIWIIGTRRVLGIREDTELPLALSRKLGDFDDVATGNFEVCPLTKEQAGHMQIVCVSSVSSIKMSKRKSTP